MKSAVVSCVKPMLRVSLPSEAAEMALAMSWRSSLALVRQVRALRGRVLLGKLTQKVLFPWHEVGRGFQLETNVESGTAKRGCSKGTGNCLEVFSGTWQAVGGREICREVREKMT